jgi:hypothetical protein
VLAFIALVAALTCPVLAAPVEVGQPTGRSKADADVTGSTPEWDTETRAAVRAAFAAVVDPVGSWAVDAFEFQEERPIGPGGAPAGWGSHFSLMFGFGGEGSMSVAVSRVLGVDC